MNCRNCGAVLNGLFCQECGQDAAEPPSRLMPVLRDAAAHVTGLEGKAIRSLLALLFYPGRLTRAFIDGHRVRFSDPVQLYLWCTAAFFLLHAYSPVVQLNTQTGTVESRISVIALGKDLSPSTMERLAERGMSIADFVPQFDTVVSTSLPVLLFGLVGAAALLMAAQFRRETALTHTIFALHWCAFYFLLEGIRHVVSHFGIWGVRAAVCGSLVALVYLTVAMRVVYRRGWLGSALRGVISVVLFALLLAGWMWATAILAERFA